MTKKTTKHALASQGKGPGRPSTFSWRDLATYSQVLFWAHGGNMNAADEALGGNSRRVIARWRDRIRGVDEFVRLSALAGRLLLGDDEKSRQAGRVAVDGWFRVWKLAQDADGDRATELQLIAEVERAYSLACMAAGSRAND